MKWYHYVGTFFAGFFLTNIIPHLTMGITGREFPSPFGDPPGVGLSSAITNIIWALINIVLGYIFLRVSKPKFNNTSAMLVLFLGIAICALMCANSFAGAVK